MGWVWSVTMCSDVVVQILEARDPLLFRCEDLVSMRCVRQTGNEGFGEWISENESAWVSFGGGGVMHVTKH